MTRTPSVKAERKELARALAAMARLLPVYEDVTDAACYHYARAEWLRLVHESRGSSDRELTERLWRQVRALERAIDEWRSDDFYALEGDHGAARLSRR